MSADLFSVVNHASIELRHLKNERCKFGTAALVSSVAYPAIMAYAYTIYALGQQEYAMKIFCGSVLGFALSVFSTSRYFYILGRSKECEYMIHTVQKMQPDYGSNLA